MTDFAYAAIGEMLIGLGNALKDPKSELRKTFHLSTEQLTTLLGVVKVAASPAAQKLYIPDLAERWGVDKRTVENWINQGYVRYGHKSKGDNRHWWLSSELDEDEVMLIRHKKVKPSNNHRWRYLIKMLNGIID